MKDSWTALLGRVVSDPERWLSLSRHVLGHFHRDQCLVAAGMLTYATLLALVPLMTVVLSIVAALPGAQDWNAQIQAFIFQNFVPAARETIEEKLTELTAGARTVTGLMGLFLVITSVILMQNIEATINRIFGVRNDRSLLNRFMVYWSALTLGPVLLGASLALSSYFFSLKFFATVETAGVLAELLRSLTPLVVSLLAFFLIFSVVPNRRVSVRHAAVGALITAVLFEIAKKGFGLYVGTFDTYTRLYGALAAIPIFLIWIYLAWSIILLGASFTAALGSFRYEGADRGWPRRSEFVLLIELLGRLWSAHQAGQRMTEEQLLAGDLKATDAQLQRLLGDLQDAGLVTREESGRWLLARDLATVTIGELYRAGDYPWPEAPDERELGEGFPAGSGRRLAKLLARTESNLAPVLMLPVADLFTPGHRAGDRESAAA